MSITNEQIAALQAKVNKLVTDKTDADAKTQKSNQDDTTAAAAVATASQSKLDEAAADSLVSTDLQDLTSYLESLVGPPAPVVPPAA